MSFPLRTALACLFVACNALHAAAVIDFESPAGGELFVVGQTQFVRLSAKTRYKRVTIELSRNGGQTFEALGEIDNSVARQSRNFLQFQVTGAASSRCVIRASAPNARGLSGEFSISVNGSLPGSGTASNNSVLTADGLGGSDWKQADLAAGPLAGDVTGPLKSNKVERIQGVSVSPSAPSDKNLLRYDAISALWTPSAFNDAVGGDLAGNYPTLTVSSVGGQTAANVATGSVLANAATSANTPNTIVKRNGSGAFSAGQVESISGGFKFPDATIQTTALVGGGVPAGYMIIGTTPTAPAGFTHNGKFIESEWSLSPSLPTSRDGMEAVGIGSKIYVVGGSSGPGAPVATNEEFDTISKTWTTKAPLPSERTDFAMTAFDGKVYVAGGNTNGNFNRTTLEVYDPATNIWSTLAPMPTGRSEFCLVEAGGKIYAIGGNAGAGPLTVVEEYDPVANSWATKAPMLTGRRDFGAASLGGMIYAFGGATGGPATALHEVYDPVMDDWTSKAPLPSAREDNRGAALNGKIYSVSGGATAAQDVVEYDPILNRWVPKSSLIVQRAEPALAVANGNIYALGGAILNLTVEAYGGLTYFLHVKN